MDEAQKQWLHQEIENATVKILIGNTFKGTGFLISPDGYVLTAYHCIGAYPPEILVETRFDGKYLAQLEPDKSLLSPQYDIAVLQVFGYRPSHYVPLGLINQENINDTVVAIGYPAGQYRIYEGRIGGVDEPTLASDVIKGEGQSGGLVYHYRTQRVVGLASAIWKREVIVNEGLAVRFENLFKKWGELREINQEVATTWDERLQRSSQKEEKPIVKAKTSWAKKFGLITALVLSGVVSYGLYNQDKIPSFESPRVPVEKPLPKKPVATDNESPVTIFQDRLKDGKLGPKMVWIPAGKFQMGDLQGEGSDDEQPVHWVEVEKFAMGQYEVTRGEFRQFIEATGYKTEAEAKGGCYSWMGKDWGYKAEFSWRSVNFLQEDIYPVVCVSWNDAMAYIKWLNQQTNRTYSLPTEAEWEYAARAGTNTKRFWGNNSDDACYYGNVADKDFKKQFSDGYIHNCTDGYIFTAPVGLFSCNRFKLCDVLGNVWEWTCSRYTNQYDKNEMKCDITNGGKRVLRGGSWVGRPDWVRSAFRRWNNPTDRGSYIGLRVVAR